MSFESIHSGVAGEKLEYVCNTVVFTLYFNIKIYDSGSRQDSWTDVALTFIICKFLGGPGTAKIVKTVLKKTF